MGTVLSTQQANLRRVIAKWLPLTGDSIAHAKYDRENRTDQPPDDCEVRLRSTFEGRTAHSEPPF